MNVIKALLGKMDVLELKFRKKNEKANDSILSALMENPEGYKLEAYIGRDEQNQTFETPSLKVFLKEGAEGLEATSFSGTFHVKDEEESKSGEKAPDSPPASR